MLGGKDPGYINAGWLMEYPCLSLKLYDLSLGMEFDVYKINLSRFRRRETRKNAWMICGRPSFLMSINQNQNLLLKSLFRKVRKLQTATVNKLENIKSPPLLFP